MESPTDSGDNHGMRLGNLVPGAVAGAAVAALGAVRPELAVAGAFAQPALERMVESLLERAGSQRRTNGIRVLSGAIEESGVSEEEFEAAIIDNPQKIKLAISAIEVAQRVYLDRHISALSRALFRGGLSSDRAEVDLELLVVQALGEFESSHMRVLFTLADRSRRDVDGQLLFLEFLPGERLAYSELNEILTIKDWSAIDGVLNALVRHGAVEVNGFSDAAARTLIDGLERGRGRNEGAAFAGELAAIFSRHVSVTGFGTKLLDYLQMTDAQLPPDVVDGEVGH